MKDLGVAAGGFVAGVGVTLLLFRIVATYLTKLRRKEDDA